MECSSVCVPSPQSECKKSCQHLQRADCESHCAEPGVDMTDRCIDLCAQSCLVEQEESSSVASVQTQPNVAETFAPEPTPSVAFVPEPTAATFSASVNFLPPTAAATAAVAPAPSRDAEEDEIRRRIALKKKALMEEAKRVDEETRESELEQLSTPVVVPKPKPIADELELEHPHHIVAPPHVPVAVPTPIHHELDPESLHHVVVAAPPVVHHELDLETPEHHEPHHVDPAIVASEHAASHHAFDGNDMYEQLFGKKTPLEHHAAVSEADILRKKIEDAQKFKPEEIPLSTILKSKQATHHHVDEIEIPTHPAVVPPVHHAALDNLLAAGADDETCDKRLLGRLEQSIVHAAEQIHRCDLGNLNCFRQGFSGIRQRYRSLEQAERLCRAKPKPSSAPGDGPSEEPTAAAQDSTPCSVEEFRKWLQHAHGKIVMETSRCGSDPECFAKAISKMHRVTEIGKKMWSIRCPGLDVSSVTEASAKGSSHGHSQKATKKTTKPTTTASTTPYKDDFTDIDAMTATKVQHASAPTAAPVVAPSVKQVPTTTEEPFPDSWPTLRSERKRAAGGLYLSVCVVLSIFFVTFFL